MKIFARLTSLFRRKALESDMAEEMRLHLELQAEVNRKAGLNPDEARFAALRQFGNVSSIQERAREQGGWLWLEQGLQDLRYAGRQLRRNPGFAAVAVISLALGIGANTTIFSLVNEVLLKSLPVRNPGELVLFHWLSGPRGWNVPVSGSWEIDPVTKLESCSSFSLPTFERFRDHNQTLASVFAFAPLREPTVVIDGEAEVSSSGAQLVSGGYFSGLGVEPMAGRTITPDDDRPAAPPVAVISYRYWQRRFGAEPSAVGKTILVNHLPAVVIGVTPPEFTGTMDVGDVPDLSLPLATESALKLLHQEAEPVWWLRVMGRRNPGATVDQVRANFEGDFRQVALADAPPRGAVAPDDQPPEVPQLAVGSGRQGLTDFRHASTQRLMILMGLVGMVLLIACANVANLLLARGAARRREIAARLALGASRSRLVRQLLTESGLLVFLGGVAGLLLAQWGRGLLLVAHPLLAENGQPLALAAGLDWHVLAFTFIVTVGTGLLFGLIPALQATRVDLQAEFHGGSGSVRRGARSALTRGLMVAQVALSVVLLVGAGLFVRTLRNLEGVDVGFNRERLLLFRLHPAPPVYDAARGQAVNELVAGRIAALPGVVAASFSRMPLLSRAGWNSRISMAGRTPAPDRPDIVMINAIEPDFFSTLGIPLVLGRNFTTRDNAAGAKVVVINETMAKRFYPDSNPLGRHFSCADPGGKIDLEIVGVVRDAKYTDIKNETPPTAYLPCAQELDGEANYVVRTVNEPEALIGSVRALVREIDPNLPLADVRTQEAQVEKLFAAERLFARFAGFFGVLALALVCVGLYGLTSFAVTRRTSEIGIRLALGAQPGRVLWSVLRESLLMIGGGVVVGLGAAMAVTHLVANMLFGVTTADPLTYIGVTFIMLLVAVLAAWKPARRATKVDPIVALRAE